MSPELFSSLLGNVWSIFLIVLFFGGSIFFHELGHFLAARRRGVKVERFSIGFGPAIFKWRGKDGVEYRLAWLPLGGYVALPQLADLGPIEGEIETPADQLAPVSYSTKMLVFVAGAAFNVLFAFLLACVLWFVGQETSEDNSTTRIGYVSETMQLPDKTTVISPARQADLRPGDIIRAIDGERVNDWPDLLQTLVTSSGVTDDGRRKAVFSIERNGQAMDLTVYPLRVTEEKVRKVGILPAYTPIVAVVPEKSYAKTLGLQVDDELKAVNGAPLYGLYGLYDLLQAKEPAAITLTVLRAGKDVDIAIPADRPKESNAIFGASYRTHTAVLHVNPFLQIRNHITGTFRVLWSLVHPHSDINMSNMSGPVGIGKIFWDASELGFRYVLWIAILVNVNLAVFNLLPIPVLDGGQMLFATIARLRGRALSPNFVATTQGLFVVLIFSMMIYLSVFDVQRIRRDSKAEQQARESAEKQKAMETAPAKP